ncbi:sulfatase-like hydrolase/transferase [Haloferula sp. A504]|uniref:sulfatase-like hydrolase/transferase n=1 Tax=Haloferula sp. A504 TaxID=3373601 RepID=UPI0031C59C4F|nr:sulfatase-like hydrolase/transferase [Verrucomicrobiaceae bacterium E54]
MGRIRVHAWMVCLASLAAGAATARCEAPPQRPNIILLYIDDWAWNGTPVAMDDGMPNSRMPVLRMPNVAKLAGQGMKFRNAYGSPQCSPGRACVQTGQSTPRNGFSVFMNSKGQDYYDKKSFPGYPLVPCISDMSLDADALTIPKALKPLGYTCAHLGKWHLRSDPGAAGYSVHDGDTSNTPGNTLTGEGKRRLPADLSDPKLMFSLTRKAIAFMNEQVEAGTPFYLQISHYAMHEGRECLPATRAKYVDHPAVQEYYRKTGTTAETVNRKSDPAVWLGMGEDLDGRIGAVLDEVAKLGIEDETYVVLVSDNGYRHSFLPGLTQPLHGAKWWVWDGGIRVPMIVRGPGIRPGSVFDGNVINYDFLPTFVDWAGGDPEALEEIDGRSLAGYMKGATPAPEFLGRPLYFHYPHYRSSRPHSALIAGQYKVMHFYDHPEIPMLFDLSRDPGEVENIAREDPDRHAELHGEMMSYFRNVEARLPKANPDYDPELYKASKDHAKLLRWGPFKGERPLDDDER